MRISLGNNISSLMAQRQLSQSSDRLGDVLARLSSGSRINRAADDAAGLAIAENLNVSARVYSRGILNINDAVSAISIADGALSQLSGIVTRQLELASQASSGSYGYQQRKSLNAEAQALRSEFNRIIASTSFNGIEAFGSDARQMRIQFGFGINESILVGTGSELSRNVGTGNFTAGTQLATPGLAADVTLADLNGDGFLDMVSSAKDTGGMGVNVRLGNGDGTFGANTNLNSILRDTRGVATADVNGDGILDIIANGSYEDRFYVYIGNGNGTFQAGSSFSTGIGSASIGYMNIGDFNGDGRIDVVTADRNSGILSMNFGNANGSFSDPTTYNTGGSFNTNTPIAVGDINGDGHLDIAVGSGGSYISLFINNGSGSMSTIISAYSPNNGNFISLGDYNNDGIMDIMTSGGVGQTHLLAGNGNGTFRAAQNTGVNYTLNTIKPLDINGDGILDIVGTEYATDRLIIALGNGDGTFGASRTVSTLDGPSSFGFGDINGDGVEEIIIGGNATYAGVQIFSQSTTTSNTEESFDLTSVSGAREALDTLRAVLERVTSERGALGAHLSRLSIASQNIMVARENYTAARSRIIDDDVAVSAAELTRLTILQQVASSVVAQANTQPEIALRLLRDVNNA